MNCKTARQNIALHAGNDLDALSVRELRVHLQRCPECAVHWKQMRESIKALHVPSRESTSIHDSVWPGVSHHLSARPPRQQSDRFHGWAPAVAVVASCMVMLFVAQQAAPVGDAGASHGLPQAVQPIATDWSAAPTIRAINASELSADEDYLNEMMREWNSPRSNPLSPAKTGRRSSLP